MLAQRYQAITSHQNRCSTQGLKMQSRGAEHEGAINSHQRVQHENIQTSISRRPSVEREGSRHSPSERAQETQSAAGKRAHRSPQHRRKRAARWRNIVVNKTPSVKTQMCAWRQASNRQPRTTTQESETEARERVKHFPQPMSRRVQHGRVAPSFNDKPRNCRMNWGTSSRPSAVRKSQELSQTIICPKR